MATSEQVRRQFIDYFARQHGHEVVPSSPVVPHDDPTLLFTNAGMNQFKDVFLATGSRDYRRAVNTQKCIRAGGKHNDLEDVGRDTYHHTFFEMLGNWSFGDYFKKEVIAWAWDLLTNVWGLDKARLHATVFAGDQADGLEPDEEAANLWRSETDIDPAHIHYCGKADNFWEMGDTGPCGPCSEVHVDWTPDLTGGKLVNADDARVIEIWNLVFIQYNRARGEGGKPGALTPLPARHVDTGMGFERMCAVLQGTPGKALSNYDTDVFTPIFAAVQDVTGAKAYGSNLNDPVDTAYRVLADHVRCLTFALTDGATPSNEGRGYVLRRILRRAVRHGRQTLGVNEPFLHRLVPSVVQAMSSAFPELDRDPQGVIDVIKDEEQSFGKTLGRGIELFHQAAERGNAMILAEDAFKLHDTYGFPLDLTEVMAEEQGITVDVEGFQALMEKAREQARAGGGSVDDVAGLADAVRRDQPPETEFVGYDHTESSGAIYCLLYRRSGGVFERCGVLQEGEEGAVVVERTSFYAEAGGQVGDRGIIAAGSEGVFDVTNTVKVGGVYCHLGTVRAGRFVESPLADAGQALAMAVDAPRRARIMVNHTGTHLMNRALREVLGEHVQQKGSLVDDEKLRFDLSHDQAINAEQIERVESMVNNDIAADLQVYAETADQADALKINGLRAVFGERYPARVRVVSVGAPVDRLIADPGNADWRQHSMEFCGGTHVAKTGDIEGFVIVAEEAVAKGVRRVTALTGQAAHRAAAMGDLLLRRVEGLAEIDPERLAAEVADMASEIEGQTLTLLAAGKLRGSLAKLQKKVKEHQKQRSQAAVGAVIVQARSLADQIEGDVYVGELAGADANGLRTAMEVIRKMRPEAAALLGSAVDGRVSFVASVPKALIEKGLKAGDWVKRVAEVAGGGGGGRPDMAQAGGKDPSKLAEALEAGRRFAAERLPI